MNLSFLIAKRYFISKHKRSFISVISNISMIGVGVGTMALIIVLSVFNGLEGLHRKLFSTIDADIKITARLGKNFEADSVFLEKIKQTEGVALVTEVIEDNALVRYNDAQMVVTLRGVSDNFLKRARMDSVIIDGRLVLKSKDVNYAVIGQGVQHILSVTLSDDFSVMEVWYPDRKNKNLLSQSAFNRQNIRPGGVFALEQQYDDTYMFVPLSFAQELLEYGNRRTALEVQLTNSENLSNVKHRLSNLLGDAFLVQDQDEQHASVLRAIQIEKFFVFITLSFILAVASFNIFFSLTMLAIDKKKDIAILYAMGAPQSLIKRIFIAEGTIVAFLGAFCGLVLGALICWLQQTYGLISMGMATSVIEAYPVKMQLSDFLFTGVTIVIITFLASYFPAQKAARQMDFTG